MRTLHVIGNWKMHGNKKSIGLLLETLLSVSSISNQLTVVVCPPAPYLDQVRELIKGSYLKLGAQNMHYEFSGAFTGEAAPSMLIDLSCQYVIIGHSERRQMGEDDQLIAKKCMAAQKAGLKPILCIGENLQQHEADQTFAVLEKQLENVLSTNIQDILIAYEPVWAIGSGKVADAHYVQSVHQTVRGFLRSKNPDLAEQVGILYGGSVKSTSVDGLLSCPDIDGLLVGGASLDGAEFLKICQAASRYVK